jgi:glycosyltransferase involved in cell wall biosynthesis
MISIVIPVLNEEQNLVPLHREIDEVLRSTGLQAEMIIIDDGSKDGSWNEVVQLARRDPRVQGIRFRRNFGKAAALSAGFACVRGEFVVTLDADLQDNPSEIPSLVAQLEAGFDLVSGWKRRRFDPWHKVIPSRIFNWIIRLASG